MPLELDIPFFYRLRNIVLLLFLSPLVTGLIRPGFTKRRNIFIFIKNNKQHLFLKNKKTPLHSHTTGLLIFSYLPENRQNLFTISLFILQTIFRKFLFYFSPTPFPSTSNPYSTLLSLHPQISTNSQLSIIA